MAGIAPLLLAALGLWYALDTLRAKEIAGRAALAACTRLGVQLLDETVEKRRTRLGRGESGRLQFDRRYVFLFSVDGTQRRRGRVRLLGTRVVEIELEGFAGLD